MIVRALDINGDWLFGKGRNDYVSQKLAVAQTINSRLLMFLGDCFFALNQGIDWFNMLGSKDQKALSLAISSTILNTQGVLKMVQLSVNLDSSRQFTIRYNVNTVFGQVASQVQANPTNYILDEYDNIIVTENSNAIITEQTGS